jgi:hypothetical protein
MDPQPFDENEEPPPPPVLRREEFIDVGPLGVRTLIDYNNDVPSVTFEGTVYPVQLDANNKKFIMFQGQRYFKVEQPPGLFGAVGGRRRSRRRRSRKSKRSRRSRRV